MKPDKEWTELAREGHTVAAIVTYRASAGVGLGEAKEAVEAWVTAHLPPSVGYQLAARIGRRVDDQLAAYTARTGKELSYLIHALTVTPAEHLGHPSMLFAVLPEGHPGRDLAVVIPLPGTSRTFCRQSVRDELAGGAQAVWLVDSETRTVTVYQEGRRGTEFDGDDALDGGDVLPGFSCKVSDLFG